MVKDGKFDCFDYDHCKGCGICAKECPVNIKAEKEKALEKKAIEMVEEIRE
jgi:pyruvate ferredoxin oxidoreductase delta subunit